MGETGQRFKEQNVFTTYFNTAAFFNENGKSGAHYVRLMNDDNTPGRTSVRFDTTQDLVDHLREHGNNITLEDGTTRKFGFDGNVFDNHDLSGVNLSGMYMEQVSFNNCDLSGANFNNSKFVYGASFRNSNMEGTSMANIDASESGFDMSGAKINNGDFSGAHIRSIVGAYPSMENTRMTGMQVDNAGISGPSRGTGSQDDHVRKLQQHAGRVAAMNTMLNMVRK